MKREANEGDFESFGGICPEIANKELYCLDMKMSSILPRGRYYFLESYCNDRNCDCRKVIIIITNGKKIFATIGYGWESLEFYKNWIGDKNLAKHLLGASLEMGGFQSEFANDFLNIFKKLISDNSRFTEMIKNHYKLFKDKLK